MADVKVDVKVDDKGSLNQVGKSAQSARRQIGGVAKTASAGSKSFSKMSQGITGGLVPAYAQLAATLFAVDAVFRTLKEGADLRVQREGMLAYANQTGIALSLVSKRLAEATQHQIDFKSAAQASAIGMAAGLTARQMEEIGVAANKASKALGTDFTDSFNRLVRGIVKGEPELLDELGIILRLDTATREYAQANDLNQKSLTGAERTQAVHANVMGQVIDKYDEMGEAIKASGIQQLATSLENLKQSVLAGLSPIAEFLANVLSGNLRGVIALMGVFAASVISKILPSMDDINKRSQQLNNTIATSDKQSQVLKRAGSMEVSKAQRNLDAGPLRAETAKSAQGMGKGSKIMGKVQAGEKLSKRENTVLKKMLKKAENEHKIHGKAVTGYMKGESLKRIRQLKKNLKNQEVGWKKHYAVVKAKTKMAGIHFKVAMKRMELTAKKSFAVMSKAGTMAGRAMNTAMKAAGFIGMAIMLWDIFKSLKKNIDGIMIWIGEKLKAMGNLLKKSGIGYILGWALDKAGSGMVAGGEAVKKSREMKREIEASAKAAGDWLQNMKDINAELDKINTKDPKNTQEGDIIKKNIAQTQVDPVLSSLEGFATTILDKNVGNTAKVEALSAMNESMASLGGQYASTWAAYYNSIWPMMAANNEEGLKAVFDGLQVLFADYQKKDIAKGMGWEGMSEEAKKYATQLHSMTESLGSTAYDKQIQNLTTMKGLFSAALKDASDETLNEKVTGGALKIAEALGIQNAENMTNAEVQERVNTALEHYILLQEKERTNVLLGAQLGTQMVTAGRHKGALGADQKRNVKLKQDQLAIDNQLLMVQRATDAFKNVEHGLDQQAILDAQQELDMQNELLRTAQAKAKVYEESTSVIGQMKDSLNMGVEKMFQDLATGAASLKDALKSLFHSILLDLAKILAKQAAVRAMGAVFGLQDGGIIGLANGGVIPRYSGGGIATEPTYLVGEGQHNEAVVPLPNGKSIPVDMKGAGGTSNITVNVSASGGQTTTSAGAGEKERKLGQMVAAAVQAEILEQQRPGNILSPYGDGDI